MQFHIVPRATGKTTYLIDKVYREPGHQIVCAWEQERHRLLDLLAHRCVEDGAPPWLPDPIVMSKAEWRTFWEHRHAVVTASGFKRGGPRKILIDNVDAVLGVLFGEVEEATATADVSTKVPRLPRTKCEQCGGPYDEDNDALGMCARCLSAVPWVGDDG